ncbi:MAG: hypothetical protein EOP92_41120 [Lysobacteraceae bacterium]|jgi:hypothetical protein|nr:MAG: hypothetical protein EOP92_41120 [Xanthomonadaceae bacterium]
MTLRPLALACCCLAVTACKPTPSDAPPAQASAPTPAKALEKAAAGLNPLASAEDRIKASMDKFLAVRSYHARIEMEGQPGMGMEMDYVAPDRFRIQMPAGTQVIIGDTMHMQVQGRSMKMPMATGTLTQWRDPLKIRENQVGMSVESLGSDTVDGAAASKFLVRHSQPQPSEFTYWIGRDDLPLQLQSKGQASGKDYAMTIRYSRFNDPGIRIEVPQ